MSRKKNIKIQLHQKVDSLLCIGESKHQAKISYQKYCKENNIKGNPTKTIGIYSTGSADIIRQSINNFTTWLKDEKPEVWNTKNLDSITKEVAYDYLKQQDKVNSAYTVSTRMSSLNKVLDLSLTKKEVNLRQRRNPDITRSRTITKSDGKYNPANYREGLLIANSFGLRSESLINGNYKVKDISIFKNQEKVYLAVIEKGGRYREIPCLQENQEQVLETFDISERDFLSKDEYINLYNNSSTYLVNKYTRHIDNHAIRADYAVNLYN
ncbi:hypothetical protein, partial [Senegalia sp. (in: firmicutes)]|uniref:hypothetical protein n=1 Tax=Senegalia sp. (in: firmicutes) TaxID=1924098 RepID=UPI003F989D55